MPAIGKSVTEVSPPPMDWRENAKDLTAGAAGGVAQVLIGEPIMSMLLGISLTLA